MASTTSSTAPFGTVHISNHPLVLSKLTQLRLHDLPAKDFREGIKFLGSMLLYEASRSIPLADVPNLQSPVAEFTGQTIPLRIGFSPILRAGTGLLEPALDMFPDATVLHLGLFRDKVTLQAIEYYSKLPTEVTADLVFVLDPLIATGGTAVAALGMLLEWGLTQSQIKIISVLGSTEGVKHVTTEYPEVEIFIGAIDEQLTDKGYISPGLGDAGDRLFST
ncbi:uracil phosphoribosyltransferase-domain-containing protein [Papiliotrema laurentii]|uniref:uracil phosphoribosyltransferase n=1 Tax=Papiliotrema laurentii TaxID=5418 RepID=A0AAD9FQ20_PAPLA|nr:uracil phosphoribosyltransferase-domain-containing protein [Papiliotrema laurentii]